MKNWNAIINKLEKDQADARFELDKLEAKIREDGNNPLKARYYFGRISFWSMMFNKATEAIKWAKYNRDAEFNMREEEK